MQDDKISSELRNQLIESARRMRSEPTRAERELWKRLRLKQLDGFKFRRQHVVHTFIVDFYCPSAKLVIEVDGEFHEQHQENDYERTEILKILGPRVLRFKNKEIENNLEGVLLVVTAKLHGK